MFIFTHTHTHTHTQGLLIGSVVTEFGGPCTIECKKTGFSCDLKFNLKPMFGGSVNGVEGKIRRFGETVCTLRGRWDDSVVLSMSDPDSTKEKV